MAKLYLIGSLRNNAIPALAARLRKSRPEFEIFDDWFAAGPEADDWWKTYEQARYGTDSDAYVTALGGYAAGHVFDFDKHHLDTSTHALLVLPAGKSGHMEIMYAAYGTGANTAILLEEGADPRWDVMYKFIPNILTSFSDVEEWLSDRGTVLGRSRPDPYDATYCGKAIKDMTREELMDALVERGQAFDRLLKAHSREWDVMMSLRKR